VISIDSIAIEDEWYSDVRRVPDPAGPGHVDHAQHRRCAGDVAVAIYLAHFTRFGRTVYAIGGNEQSALLMGLRWARTKVLGLHVQRPVLGAGRSRIHILHDVGQSPACAGMELSAITVVVVRGTLLTGGSGYVVGTLFGVLIYGTIETIFEFHGGLSSWWTQIVNGLLLLASACCSERSSGPAGRDRPQNVSLPIESRR